MKLSNKLLKVFLFFFLLAGCAETPSDGDFVDSIGDVVKEITGNEEGKDEETQPRAEGPVQRMYVNPVEPGVQSELADFAPFWLEDSQGNKIQLQVDLYYPEAEGSIKIGSAIFRNDPVMKMLVLADIEIFEQRFRGHGLGTGMIQIGINQSNSLGYGGCVIIETWLHEAKQFYYNIFFQPAWIAGSDILQINCGPKQVNFDPRL